jgi:hypothetical protein
MKDYTVIKSKVNISKGRSDEFNDGVKELSNFIEGLDLDLVPHSKLMYLVLTQIRVAERDAFTFGFNMAAKLMHDYYSDEMG